MMTNSHRECMQAAEEQARKSEDTTKVGAAIFDDGMLMSAGFNRFPDGVARTPERCQRPAKYSYTIHAEVAAVCAAARVGDYLSDCTMYLSNGTPCDDCAKVIIAAGIRGLVVFARPFSGSPAWDEKCKLGMELLLEAGVRVRRLNDDYEEVHA